VGREYREPEAHRKAWRRLEAGEQVVAKTTNLRRPRRLQRRRVASTSESTRLPMAQQHRSTRSAGRSSVC